MGRFHGASWAGSMGLHGQGRGQYATARKGAAPRHAAALAKADVRAVVPVDKQALAREGERLLGHFAIREYKTPRSLSIGFRREACGGVLLESQA